jgi:hypothetical protein
MGGDFTSIAPIPVTGIAAIPTDLTPNTTTDLHELLQGAEGDVLTVATSGDWIYLGGSFAEFRGETTGPLVKVSLSTGELDPDFQADFIEKFSLAPDPTTDFVSHLTIDESEQTLYVGGFFRNSETSASSVFAKIDLATGDVDASVTEAINGALGEAEVRNLAVSSTMIEICADSSCYGYSKADGSRADSGYTPLS